MDRILFKHHKNWGLDDDRVMGVTKKVLKKLNFGFDVELSVVFLGRDGAKKLNKRYRKMDYVPQVLAFPNSRQTDSDKMVRLGDVVICTSKLKEENKLAENRDVSIYKILEKWMEHGVNNLLK